MKNTRICVVRFNSFSHGVPAIILKQGKNKTKVQLTESSTTHSKGEIVRVWNRMITMITG